MFIREGEEAEICDKDICDTASPGLLMNLRCSGHSELSGPAEVAHSFLSKGSIPADPLKTMSTDSAR